MNIKPYKQGYLDCLCSVYSTVNALKLAGVNMTTKQAQAVMEDVVEALGAKRFTAIFTEGADGRTMNCLFKRFNRVINRYFDVNFTIQSPYKNKRIHLDDLLSELTDKVALIRVVGPDFDHYTVFKGVVGDRICFFDSDRLPSLPIDKTATDKSLTYRIVTKQIYLFEVQNKKS